jgi:hypothetical protein
VRKVGGIEKDLTIVYIIKLPVHLEGQIALYRIDKSPKGVAFGSAQMKSGVVKAGGEK